MSKVKEKIKILSNNTFKKTKNQIISDHTTFFKNKFDLEVHEENKIHPNIHWAPKLHKHPKTSFLIAAL